MIKARRDGTENRRTISRLWYWADLAALIVVGTVAAVMVTVPRPVQVTVPRPAQVTVPRPAQVTLSMRSVRPLTTAACVAEAHRYGYSISAGRIICPSGFVPSWYHATLVNRGSYALVDCSAAGYSSRGKAVFHGPLPFAFAGIRGLFAGHGTTTFYWYLPKPTAAPVLRYTASCPISSSQF